MSTNDLLEEANERLDRIENLCKQMRELLEVITDMQKEAEENAEKADILLDNVRLSLATRNALKRAGYKTVGDLKGLCQCDLKKIHNIGFDRRTEIVTVLHEYGIDIPYYAEGRNK